jgi:LPS sulfotransferase NodH
MPVLQTPSFVHLAERPPVIIVGMHRSGTSLLCRLLGMMGIHLGHDLGENSESHHLQGFNKRTLHVVGADWNTPEPVIKAMQDPAFAAAQAAYYRAHIFAGVGGVQYWGIGQWLALRCRGSLPLWGWKDPRTSLTLPVWLRLFPQAYVVHIIRNGIDVAISLHRRQIAKSERWRVHPDHRDPRGSDFRFCFSLWETYQAHLLTYRDSVPTTQYTELRYETLLREPEATLRYLLSKIGVTPNEARLSQALTIVNADRLDNRTYAAAYQDIIPELTENPLMRELGYPEESRSVPPGQFA